MEHRRKFSRIDSTLYVKFRLTALAVAFALAFNEAQAGKALLQPVNPPDAQIPNISQAMRVRGGDLLFLSGHVPISEDGSIVRGGLEAQIEQAFRNLQSTLRAAGAEMSNVARLTFYIRGYEPAPLPVIRRVRDRFVNLEQPPASVLIGVDALFQPEVLIEIDAIAVLPKDSSN